MPPRRRKKDWLPIPANRTDLPDLDPDRGREPRVSEPSADQGGTPNSVSDASEKPGKGPRSTGENLGQGQSESPVGDTNPGADASSAAGTDWKTAIETKLGLLPKQPGVYIFRDARGRVIYVGKAKVLANRVRNYFRGPAPDDNRLRALRRTIRTLDYIALATEMEALILESHLIKQYHPRFNIQLKDDKKYPYLKVTPHAFPALFLTRQVVNDGSRYFGPFIRVKDFRKTLRVLRKVFQLRNCTDQRLSRGGRECLQFFIGNCSAPCTQRVDQTGYAGQVGPLVDFLSGKGEEVLASLRGRMHAAASEHKFEEAARLRDGIQTLDLLMREQRMTPPLATDADVIGMAMRGNHACAVFLHVRESKVLGKTHRILKQVEGRTESEALRALLLSLFLHSPSVPGRVITRVEPEDRAELEEVLGEQAGHRVHIETRTRGELGDLLAAAAENAHLLLEEEELIQAQKKARVNRAVYELQSVLDLPNPPYQIEGFDISNTQGAFPVASVVCFRDGKPWKGGYRRIKMDSIEGPDDFAMMEAAVRRRLQRVEARGEVPPDLILIDGGIGQVGRARRVLEEMGFSRIPLVGLAKKEEEIVLPQGGQPIRLPRSSQALQLLQRVRDEAHRFAVTYHRKRRTGGQRSSKLDSVPGIGPVRRRQLLRTFGSVRGILAAGEGRVAETPGIGEKVARALFENLAGAPSAALRPEPRDRDSGLGGAIESPSPSGSVPSAGTREGAGEGTESDRDTKSEEGRR